MQPQPPFYPSDDQPPGPPPRPKQPLTGGVEIAPNLRVLPDALRFSFARSSGPGGQNVNKLSTKAQLRIRLADLPIPHDAVARLRTLAGFRVVGAGDAEELLLQCEAERSQEANKQQVLAELRRLLIESLKRPKRRRPTKPSKGAQRRRLEGKKIRSDIKRMRRGPD